MSDLTQSQGNDAMPTDLYGAWISGTKETIASLMKSFTLDFGCRPHPQVKPDGSVRLQFFATQERFRELQSAGYLIELGENVSALGRARQAEVGQGDRFEGGRITPRGLGLKPRRDSGTGSAS